MPAFHHSQVEPIVQPGNELNTHHILIYQCTENVTVSRLFMASNCD